MSAAAAMTLPETAEPQISQSVSQLKPDVDGDLGVDDNAVLALHDRLRNSVWRQLGEDQALAPALCALILHTNPMIKTGEAIDALPVVEETLDLVDVANTMANLDRDVRSLTVTLEELDSRFGVCLFIRKGDDAADRPREPLVITNIREAEGERIIRVFSSVESKSYELSSNSPECHEPGTAILFLPYDPLADATSPEARRATKHSWFRAILSRFKSTAGQLLIVSFMLNAVSLGTPLFIMLTYDRVIAPRTTDPLIMLAMGATLALAMEVALRGLRSQIIARMTARMDFLIGTAIFARLLRLPPTTVEGASVSAQIARIKTFESIRDFFCGPVFMSVVDLPMTILAIAVIGYFGGALALVPAFAALAYIVVFAALWPSVRVAIRRAATLTSVSQQFAIETFEKLDTIRLSGLENIWARKFKDISGRDNHAQFRLHFLGAIGESLGNTVSLMTSLATLAVGVNLIWSGEISVGVLIAAMMLVWRFLAPFQSLCSLLPRFEQTRNGLLQINKLMEVDAEDASESTKARPPEFQGRVGFSSVSMRYEQGNSTVFMGLTFDAAPGEIVAITGPNGSGKSSVLKLVQGLCKPLTGSIRIDGFDIRQLVKRDLRRRIAYVPQHPQFLPGTIAENIRFIKPLASDEELWEALRRVGAEEEVRKLPRGLDTPVTGEECANLSSEFAYYLAFARVLLQNSAVILIDELPNALISEPVGQTMLQIVRSAHGNRTVLFVTHRADLMREADKVVALRPSLRPICGPLDKVLELTQ